MRDDGVTEMQIIDLTYAKTGKTEDKTKSRQHHADIPSDELQSLADGGQDLRDGWRNRQYTCCQPMTPSTQMIPVKGALMRAFVQ